MLYFDTAASYPVLPEVIKRLNHTISNIYGNPSSDNIAGSSANALVEDAREKIADAIGAMPSEIVFTSGATESNNQALKGVLENAPPGSHLITSSTEHKCILAIAKYLELKGIDVTLVKPDSSGRIGRREIEPHVRETTKLVSIMHVNNELGTVNQIEEIGALCSDRNIKFHTDAAQSFLKVPIDVDDMNIDLLSLSAHKIGGPKGIGALFIRNLRTSEISPVIHGAGQESGLRGGTVAAPLVDALGCACDHFPQYYEAIKQNKLKDKFLNRLSQLNIVYGINAQNPSNLPSLLSLGLPNTNITGLRNSTYQTLALSVGSACSSKEIEASHVLTTIGLDREMSSKVLRVSFHHSHDNEAIEELAQHIKHWTS